MTKKELKEKIENIEINYDYEKVLSNLYKLCDSTQDFNFEYLFEEFITYDYAEDMAKRELEEYGLARLKYFIGNTTFTEFDNIFKINAYGNLENVYKEDLELLKESILEVLEIEEENENE